MLYESRIGKGDLELDPLMYVSYLASKSLDLDEVLPETLGAIAELLPAECLTILQLSEKNNTFNIRASWISKHAKSSFLTRRNRFAGGYLSRPVYDVQLNPAQSRRTFPYLTSKEYLSALRIPLVVNHATIGRFDIIREGERKFFADREQRLAEACGKILGSTLRNGVEYARMAWLAEHDALTGIGNRRQFDTALARELTRAERYRRDLTLVLIDLDDFKEANTKLGLSGGDEILRRTARVLVNGARQGVDVSCRIGGDEFAMLLPEINESAASELAQRLLKEVVKATAPLWPIRFSYSISSYPHTTAERLRKMADSRLLDAKTHKQVSLNLVQ